MKHFLRVLRTELSAMAEDARVYWDKRWTTGLLYSVLYVITTHGWHIMILFRLGKIIYAIPIPIISHVLKIAFQLIWFFMTTFYGIWIDLAANVGKGFYIGHYGGIILAGNFGDYCSVGQGVTVGYKGAGKSDKWPEIGNGVYIGAGAKVIGDISVGSDSVIGANSVVVKSISENSLAVGVPAIEKSRESVSLKAVQ